jgi:hypothetical protein
MRAGGAQNARGMSERSERIGWGGVWAAAVPICAMICSGKFTDYHE